MREQITTVVPEILLDGIIEQFHPVRVILFGSRARGEPGRTATTISWWSSMTTCLPQGETGTP